MRVSALCLAFTLLNFTIFGAEADSDSHADLAAQQLITSLHESLITVMKSGLDFKHRYEQLQPDIEGAFDTSLIAKISVGRAWRKMNTAQRTQFTMLISELIVATYAHRFETFNNQKFLIISTQPSSRGPVVKARIELDADDPVILDYHLRGNKIYNVIANGVSDLSLKRADYGAVIAAQGIDGLMQKIRNNIDQYRNADP